MIEEILNFLRKEYSGEGYYIKDFSNNIYFGKDEKNNYIFARINSSNDNRFNLKTKTIELFQNYDFIFNSDDEVIEDNFDVLILNKTYSETLPTFINLCLNFYNKNEDKSIIELTEDLIELYKTIGTGDYTSQQGFWAELFTIIYLYDNYGIDIANYWHSDPFNKYDFSLNENTKIEVKSTLKEYREHTFSHEQIYTPNKVFVSSVMMKKDDQGITIRDLFKKVKELFSDSYEVFKMLETEMTKYLENNLIKYDYKYSEDNIKFYINSNIPKFEIPEPDGVHGTTYLAQLENIQSLDDDQISEIKTILKEE